MQMIYMEVNLVLQPGSVEKYNELEKDLWAHSEKAGFKQIGSWRTTIGNVNEVTWVGASEDMAHMEKISVALTQNREYIALAQKLAAITVSRVQKVMRPTQASPLK
jgi:hypothetical protein